jgi:Protein of unknown function (DUF2817)
LISWFEARQEFVEAARFRGADVAVYLHPTAADQQGRRLTVDAAYLARRNADAAVVIISGTHGIEGVFGSRIQRDWLRTNPAPSDAAMLFVHVLNPHGFARASRCDENNVDVNRNFVDFTRPLPKNDAYAQQAGNIAPQVWIGPERDEADRALVRWISESGQAAVQRALTGGQYQFSDGLFFGGVKPSWSRTVIEAVFCQFLAGMRRVVLLDLHSGLGARATCQVILKVGDLSQTREFFSDVVQPGTPAAVSSPLSGTLAEAAPRLLPRADVTGLVAEFGTLPPLQVLNAVRGDNWLRHHGQTKRPAQAEIEEIREAMIASFAPDDAEWNEAVKRRGVDLIAGALALATSGSRLGSQQSLDRSCARARA